MSRKAKKRSLAELVPDPANAKKHPERNIAMIEDALRKVGPGRSIVVDEHGVILAGNATVEAARRAGIENVKIIESDGKRLIAVRVSGLTPEQKAHLAIADNRAGELGEWSPEQVKGLMEAGFPVLDYFAAHELDALMDQSPADESSATDAEYGNAKWAVTPKMHFGRYELRMTDDQADRLRTVIDIATNIEDLGAIVEQKCA